MYKLFKRIGDNIVSADSVTTPDMVIDVTTPLDVFPVEGWYLASSLEDAVKMMSDGTAALSITPRQIRLHLNATGLRQAVEDYVAASSQDIKDWWEFSLSIERNSPLLIGAASALGLTPEQLDQFFIEASKL